MKKIVISVFTFATICFFSSCKDTTDTVVMKEINGTVFNNCTDSGITGVTVYLQTFKDKDLFVNTATVSVADGKFTFKNAEIHSDSKFTYALYIESKSGGISSNPALTETGITGTTVYFNRDKAGQLFNLKIKPHYLSCTYYFQTAKTSLNDSLTCKIIQRTLQKNAPDDVYFLGGGTAAYGDYRVNLTMSNTITYTVNSANYPMGKYDIELNIWKNGVHTSKTEDIYLGWGANATHTINW